jgi:hypothetical protein
MLSIRFLGPIDVIQPLRDAMRPAGATKVGYKVNNDGLTARLYVDFGTEASLAILANFYGGRSEPPAAADKVVIEATAVTRSLPPADGGRLKVTWRS